MEEIFAKAPRNAHMITGGDIIAKIAILKGSDLVKLIGPNGIKGSNSRGIEVLSLLSQNKMTVENTFFSHDNYITCYHKETGVLVTYHTYATLQFLHKNIYDCSVVNNSVEGNHLVMKPTITITKIKCKAWKSLPRETAH